MANPHHKQVLYGGQRVYWQNVPKNVPKDKIRPAVESWIRVLKDANDVIMTLLDQLPNGLDLCECDQTTEDFDYYVPPFQFPQDETRICKKCGGLVQELKEPFLSWVQGKRG